MSGPTGLDYAAVEAASRILGVDLGADEGLPFKLLQALEGERLSYWAEERAKQEKQSKAKSGDHQESYGSQYGLGNRR